MAKTAIITGGSHGIGRGTARVLAKLGYDLVIAHHHDTDNAQQVQRAIEHEDHQQCGVFEGDLTQPDVPPALVSYAVEALGTIGALVNNAGVTRIESALTLTVPTMDYLFALNYRAPMQLTRLVAEHLIEHQAEGSIINMASVRGLRVYAEDAIYAGLKAALIHSSQALALDLAPYRIRVNCIAPGGIPDDLPESAKASARLGNPSQRIGTPADIGRTVAWLISDQAAHVTGSTIVVDGGEALWAMAAVR